MPAGPPGIFSVTAVSGRKPEAGVKVAVSPATRQLPGILGDSLGNGVFGASAEEKVSVTGAPPLAWRVPAAGETDSRVSGPTGVGVGEAVAVGAVCLVLPSLTSFSLPEPDEVAAYAQPATITAAAPAAVAAISRFRSSVAPTLPAPPELPKNDTAWSPQSKSQSDDPGREQPDSAVIAAMPVEGTRMTADGKILRAMSIKSGNFVLRVVCSLRRRLAPAKGCGATEPRGQYAAGARPSRGHGAAG